MIVSTVDIIIRRSLLEKSMPIHFYAEYLFHASACLRELSIDTLKIINTVQLAVDETGNVDLPEDFQDDVAVSLNGGVLSKLPHQDYISPIRVHNATTGAYEQQTSGNIADINASAFFSYGWGWYWRTNEFGEFTGGYFGANGGTSVGFTVIKEQRRIQMSSGFEGKSIVLMYVSDGQSVDNASQIDIKAINAIQRWIDWKSGKNAGIIQSAEGQTFFKAKKNLKARMNDLDIATLRNIILNSYTGAIKN